jgi:hypothetical protein
VDVKLPARLLSRIPVARRPTAAWIETAFLVLLVPLCGMWLNPTDPLFVRTAFPWAILAPLVAALRYGFAPGFGAAAALAFLTVAGWKGLVPLRIPAGELSAERTVGLLLAGMLAGEFSGLWRRRMEALERVHAHQRLRFESFLRSYQALRLSHELLESRLGGASPTLREALRALGDLPLARPDALAQRILELCATFAQVRQGAIFLAGAADGPLPSAPTAALGPAPELADPIVAEALRRREVVAFDSALAATAGARSPSVVLAAPLEDVEGRLWGVLAVTDLPFAAYDNAGAEPRLAGTPARFAALAGHLADRLAFGAPAELAEGRQAEGVQAFARRLRRAAHDRRAHGIPSGVVQLAFDTQPGKDGKDGKSAPALAETIARQRRVTDHVLTARRRDGRAIVTLLLPMTDDLGVARYLGRVEAAVREATGASLSEAGVSVVQRAAIDDTSRIAALDLDGETAVALAQDQDDDEPAPRETARR